MYQFFRRVRCRIFGCWQMAYSPCCERCGLEYYDEHYVHGGLWWMLKRAVVNWWRKHGGKIVGRKCEVCNRRYWRGYDDVCCSSPCFDKWIPF